MARVSYICGEADMKTKSIRMFALLALLITAGIARAAGAEVVAHTVRGQFEDVKERVMLAIENRGLVLNYTARVGDMLERTGKDIGRTRPIYATAEVLEFCSARLSRETMEADPRNIVFCPYAIAIYVLPKDPGTVHVIYRKPEAGSGKSIKALRELGNLLDEIVREALR